MKRFISLYALLLLLSSIVVSAEGNQESQSKITSLEA